MEIALIANDTKKELMTQFCIAYCGVLAKHNLCATKMTGRLISEATGLKIEHVLPGRQGDVQNGFFVPFVFSAVVGFGFMYSLVKVFQVS